MKTKTIARFNSVTQHDAILKLLDKIGGDGGIVELLPTYDW